jgi:putative hydrolase of the HAD superfamily
MEGVKKHLIFDLDDTIWDYQQNSKDTLTELYSTFKLIDEGVSNEEFLKVFRDVNNGLWNDFDRGVITRDVIRKNRFPSVLEKLSVNLNGVAVQMQDDFMEICSSKKGLVNGALQVLEKFKDKYQYHILSNGFDEVQFKKLEASGVYHFFTNVITSGQVGFRKPQPEIFEYVLDKISATNRECLMIGDNPISDIEGAYNFGIDQIYYNVHKKSCKIVPTHTISNFSELLNLI